MKRFFILLFSVVEFFIVNPAYASNAGFSRVIVATSTISVATGVVTGTYFITITGLPSTPYTCWTTFYVANVNGPQIPPVCNFQEGTAITPVTITTTASGYGVSASMSNFNSGDNPLPGPTCPPATNPRNMFSMTAVSLCSTTSGGGLSWTTPVPGGTTELIWI